MSATPRDEWWEREKSSWPNHEHSEFVMASGIRWHLQRAGHGPGMLLIHGTGASTHTWRDLFGPLAERYSVLAVDLPGHGFTDAVAAKDRSISGMSRCVNALLRELDFQVAFCVGHSAGAVILCRMVLDGYIVPRAVVSINGAYFPLGGPGRWLFAPVAQLLTAVSVVPRLLARRADDPAQVERVLAGTGSRLDATGVSLYRRLVRNPRHIAGALGMMASWDLAGFDEQMRRLDVRLVLLVGDRDRTVPPTQAHAIARRVAASRVIEIAGLGHLAHEEAPERLAREILQACAGDVP